MRRKDIIICKEWFIEDVIRRRVTRKGGPFGPFSVMDMVD